MRIDGVKIATDIYAELRRLPAPRARMVAVLIGGNDAMASFVARKARAAQSLSVGFETVVFSGEEPAEAIIASLRSLAHDASVGGIILQLPAPAVYDRGALISAIGVAKDVDNLSGVSAVQSPAVLVARAVLASLGQDFKDCAAVRIVGNGFLVGAPIARFCAENDIPHMVADSATVDLPDFVRDGDVIISGVGKTGVICLDWMKDGAGAIDFGFPPDFNKDDVARNAERLAFYTPTPQGTGPILIACLFKNFYLLNTDL